MEFSFVIYSFLPSVLWSTKWNGVKPEHLHSKFSAHLPDDEIISKAFDSVSSHLLHVSEDEAMPKNSLITHFIHRSEEFALIKSVFFARGRV